jgi:plastocyanin
MKAGLVCFIALALGAASAVAQGRTIHGVVRVPPESSGGNRSPNPYPGRASSLQQRQLAERGSVTDAVIYVEAVPAPVDSSLPASRALTSMEQLDQAFLPRVLAVVRGETVSFPNRDPIFHNVFSVSPVKRFDLGRYVRGKSKSVTFNKAGLVNVYCEIHSDMAGFILVVPNRAYAQPDKTGRYSLPPLPPGEYTVVAWHPDLKAIRRSVQVSDSADVSLDLGF